MKSHIFTGRPVAMRECPMATTLITLWTVICTIPMEPTAMIMAGWKLPSADLHEELLREFATRLSKVPLSVQEDRSARTSCVGSAGLCGSLAIP